MEVKVPNFIKNPKDETRWKKAKEQASKTLSQDDGDNYWALTNHIYQKMVKNYEQKMSLKKSDEDDFQEDLPESDEDDFQEDLSEEELAELGDGFRYTSEDEESAGDDWLKENDKDQGEEDVNQDDEYSEYGDDEDEESHQSIEDGAEFETPDAEEPTVGAGEPEEGTSIEEAASTPKETQSPQSPQEESKPEIKAEDSSEEVQGKQSRWMQPSKEDIVSLRAHSRPWTKRARDTQRLRAEFHKNPHLAHEGSLIEAAHDHHKDREDAYLKLMMSPEYQQASPIEQMRMDEGFELDWHEKNPNQLHDFMRAHHDEHVGAKDKAKGHQAAKQQRIQDILTPASAPEEQMSVEEAMQHAGGSKDEEGTQGTIVKDPLAAFADANQDFIKQYAEEYKNKQKKVANIGDMSDFGEENKRDISRILGQPIEKNPKMEAFFSHFHPMIGMNASKVVKRLGLENHPDVDMSMLHEAGMHALFQAINDYDHDHPSKASFATHLSKKMQGLMMTAMKSQDAIPKEIRQKQKQFQAGKALSVEKLPEPKTEIKPTSAQESQPKLELPQTLLERFKSKMPPQAQEQQQVSQEPQQQSAIKRPPSPAMSPAIAKRKAAEIFQRNPAHQDKLDRLKQIDAHRSILGVKKPEGGTNE